MKYQALLDIIRDAKSIVIFGGAGLSTESGIPDFRGSGGLYQKKDESDIAPEMMLHHDFLEKHPERFFDYYRTHMLYPEAKPNAAHLAFAALEKMGKVTAVITQNIDGLHQRAGSENVIELHGSTLRNYCDRCGRSYGAEAVTETEGVPRCPVCGGIIRPDVVLYGEGLDADSWVRAETAIRKADVLIVGGTSLTVQPAASLVGAYRGEHLVIINQTRTPYDRWAELLIGDPIGEVFSEIMKAL